MYEYVALEWRTGDPKQDTTFGDERQEMLDRGWTEHLRAGWPAERMPRRLAGGICIMGRPKALFKPVAREFDYVVLDDRGGPYSLERMTAARDELIAEGWSEWRRIPWSGTRTGFVRVFSRVRPRRDPTVDTAKVKEEARCIGRLWTEEELQDLMRAQLKRTELRVDVSGVGHLDEPTDDDIARVCANS